MSVSHWNRDLFSFQTTRAQSLRFSNGQFVMLGLEEGGKPLMRAYSIASANYEEHLEFFSIKAQNGLLTSRLQHIRQGSELLVSQKPTGTLIIDNLRLGRTLYLFATGTGVAPFLSVIKDPATFERFERVVLVHGVREITDFAFAEHVVHGVRNDEFLSDTVSRQLIYYPTVTREPFKNTGRITELLSTGQLERDLSLPELDPGRDRAMVCGSPKMLEDMRNLLEARGFEISPQHGVPGDYVVERAFVLR